MQQYHDVPVSQISESSVLQIFHVLRTVCGHVTQPQSLMLHLTRSDISHFICPKGKTNIPYSP